MILRWILTTTLIVIHIYSIHGQYAQALKKAEVCTNSMINLRCPVNYVPVVHMARFGVAAIPTDCFYRPTDCFADAMHLFHCTNSVNECNAYATKSPLTNCSDEQSTYLYAEYSCIPISMDDSAKVYNICDVSKQITTDHGIIQSPGYPRTFQLTTMSCPLFIRIADHQTIRFWLTDLSIGSAASRCNNDYLTLSSDFETFQHCGSQRLAYPHSCSSSFVIEYKVSTDSSFYRGMQMYFEIFNRTDDDECLTNSRPPSTTGSEPTSTTSTYITLGLASPIQRFQICAGQSVDIQCPDNYVVSIVNNIYGVTPSNTCEPYDPSRHCTIKMASTSNCRQQCTMFYSGNQKIITCDNRNAHYRFVEYRCIPMTSDIITPNVSCPIDGSVIPVSIDRRGRFQVFNDPLVGNLFCHYRIMAKPGEIINVYSFDVNLNNRSPICSANQLVLHDDEGQHRTHVCDERNSRLIYRSCSHELNLLYFINQTLNYTSGFHLYIETEPQLSNGSCLEMQTIVGASKEMEFDLCFGQSFERTCPAGYTFHIVQAFYGVKQNMSNQCSYTSGDCIQNVTSTFSECMANNATCRLTYGSRRRLAACENTEADYLHITGQCVPNQSIIDGESINTYDICSSNNSILDFSGLIVSPEFPNYLITNRECQRKINLIRDRLLKIWINELSIDGADAIGSNSQGACTEDYLMIYTRDTVYTHCGRRQLVLPPICSSDVTIGYRTSAPNDRSYRGFQIYFEWIDTPSDFICPEPSNLLSTSTLSYTQLPAWAQNLETSLLTQQICFGSSTSLTCPRENDYVLSIISVDYGVTGTGSCQPINNSHCFQPSTLESCGTPCIISYDTPKPIVGCSNQTADYLMVRFECIPKRLPNNRRPLDICASHDPDSILNETSLIVQSPRYPTLDGTHRCSKRLETSINKIWAVYLIDLFMEKENDINRCNNSALVVRDGLVELHKCALQTPSLLLFSCSNIIELNFHSSSDAIGYRGFQIYLNAVDKPDGWYCSTNFPNTTLSTITTTSTSSNVQTLTFGGTTNSSIQQYCHFPFIYQNNQSSTCLTIAPPNGNMPSTPSIPWCSLTDNFDRDGQWGFCDVGVTDATVYDICLHETRILQCPTGYWINVQNAGHGVKLNETIGGIATCNYHPEDCFQYDSRYQFLCNGQQSCTVSSLSVNIPMCENRLSHYSHINYTCIPENLPHIPTYEFCRDTSVSQTRTRRGFLISPNYPRQVKDFTCSFNIFRTNPNDDIYLYVLDMDLTPQLYLGHGCHVDRLSMTDFAAPYDVCGYSYTRHLYDTCLDTLRLELMRLSNGTGQGVKLYFEFRQRTTTQHCRPWLTTSASSYNSSVSSTITTMSSPSSSPSSLPSSPSSSRITTSSTSPMSSSTSSIATMINTTKPNSISSSSSKETSTMASIGTSTSTGVTIKTSSETTNSTVTSIKQTTESVGTGPSSPSSTSTSSTAIRPFHDDYILILFDFLLLIVISSMIMDS